MRRPPIVGLNWGEYDQFHEWQAHGRSLDKNMPKQQQWRASDAPFTMVCKQNPYERYLVNDELKTQLGDFNLHHPLWSTTRHLATNGITAAQPLLALIKDFRLQLITTPGTPTHRWKDGQSTIDLAFASADITSRVIHYKINTRLDYDSDHLPIDVSIN
jgi:hypothetical protein